LDWIRVLKKLGGIIGEARKTIEKLGEVLSNNSCAQGYWENGRVFERTFGSLRSWGDFIWRITVGRV